MKFDMFIMIPSIINIILILTLSGLGIYALILFIKLSKRGIKAFDIYIKEKEDINK